jgi:anti-sigma regulatory factor (Ser/Thr protein kinase)
MTEAAHNDRQDPAQADVVPLLDCSFDQTALAGVRYELRAYGAANGLTDQALFNFVLAVNEIMTNTIRHAGGHGHLKLWRNEAGLWCKITDRGPGIPRRYSGAGPAQPKPGHLAGHGLWLARHICTSVEIKSGRPGARVLLRFALPGNLS